MKEVNMNLPFSFALAKRFVSDCNFPIPIINKEHFFYLLSLYEEEMGTLTEYIKLINIIKEQFNENEEEFIKYFLDTRESIIKYFHENEEYKNFNTIDLNMYKIPKMNVSRSNVYKEDNNGKYFLSIDIKKANFQCLKYFSPNLFKGKETYEEFIGIFTDNDYIKKSKYNRQVIFGQLNPSRHITLEKYLSYKIYELCKSEFSLDNSIGKLVSISNDELIYSVDNNDIDTKTIGEIVFSKLGILVNVENYKLNGYSFNAKREDKDSRKFEFYVKEYNNGTESKLFCVPLPYYALVYKLYHNKELCNMDYHFNYENIDCMFNENFIVKPL